MPVSSTVWCEPVCRSPVDLDVEVQPPVAREQVEHVVEEADAGAARAGARAVEAERQADVGLAGRAGDLGGAGHARPSILGLHGGGVRREALGVGDRRRRAPASCAAASAPIATCAIVRRKWRTMSPEAKRAAPSVGRTWLEPAT